MKISRVLVWSMLLSTSGTTLAAQSASECGTTEEVVQRYRNALGGEAALAQVHSLLIRAAPTQPHSFNKASTAHSRYRF